MSHIWLFTHLTFVLRPVTEGCEEYLEGGVDGGRLRHEPQVEDVPPRRHQLRHGAAEVVQPGGQVRPLGEDVHEVALTVIGPLKRELQEYQADLEKDP